MSSVQNSKMAEKPKSKIASKIPTSGRDSGTHSRSSSVSNLTTASDIHSEVGDAQSDSTENFKVDERVWVNGTKPGYVKFIGKTQFAPGVWAGILLDEPIGKNDGSVGGVKYFSCEPLRGIFARPSKLSRTAGGAVSGIGDSSMIGSMTPKPSGGIPSSRASVCSNSSTSPRCTKLKVGDRVTVSSLGGLKSGTLRYIGETDFAKGEWAGVELDDPSGKNDGSVAGKRYFNCPMKYGLFAPLHKVSKPGMVTPTSRPGSVRGTPLMRSNSRDSLNSSVSTCSRASRVKLGVTSLTGSVQKKAKASSGGIMTTSKALQEALKEKEQHIEQLLKERDFDRAEFARLTNHFEEVDSKSSELEKKQKAAESAKKVLEEELSVVKRKLEDIQFQLEEEKITKADFESQLQQKSLILKRIEDFTAKGSGETFLNIKEILSEKETLTEVGDFKAPTDASELEKKIAELQTIVQSLSKEKQDMCNQVAEMQKCSSETTIKNESTIASLNVSLQEKDEMIANLKNELNTYIEKVTQLVEDNKNLSEQMFLKEEQAKGYADDVIKELGEKVRSLNDELKIKSSQLAEYEACIQGKDDKISALELNFSKEAEALLQLQNDHKNIKDALKQKECEYEEKVNAQKSLEEALDTMKFQLEAENNTNKQKINLLEEEIKTKSCLLSDYLSSIEEKENLITSLQQNFDSQAALLLQLQSEKKCLNDSLRQKESELVEKTTKIQSLEEQITVLTAQNESTTSEKEKKMIDLVKEIERLTNFVQEKEDQLLKVQTELSESQSNIEKLNGTIQELTQKLEKTDLSFTTSAKDAAEKIECLQNQLNILNQEKADIKSEYEKEVEILKTAMKVQEDELNAKKDIIAQHESQISLLDGKLKKNDEEFSTLKKEIDGLVEKSKEYSNEIEKYKSTLTENDKTITDLTSQVESFKKTIDKNNLSLEENAKQLQTLQDSLNVKEEENNQLVSKLQLAEQNVEMLNKDSSEHVMALQAELSKIKEESTTAKTHLEQELTKLKSEKEKLTEAVNEKTELLLQKEESFASLEKVMKEKESEIAALSAQKEDISQTLSKCQLEIEGLHQDYSRKITQNEKALHEKIEELSNVKTEIEKLRNAVKESEETLLKKDEVIGTLETSLKDRDSEICSLSNQNAELQENIAKFSADIEQDQKLYDEKLASSVTEYDQKLKEKDMTIQDIQNELKKCTELLENKTKELSEKDGEICNLKNVVKEKDNQFEELSKMVELSQCQLAMMKELSEKNESALKSKELFINDFKMEQEKQLLIKEQMFKEETERLEKIIQSKDEEVKAKQTEISNLSNEMENKKTLLESLQKELEAAKSEKKKMSDNSSNTYQELNRQITEMEEKFSKVLQEKEKIAEEELKAKEDKKKLELARDSLLQEKSAQEEIVKDREAKLAALQAEVDRMREDFTLHKQELQQKLDISEMELQAVSELKTQLELQHSVLEELQENLHNSDEKCKKLEAEVQIIPVITTEKDKLQAKVDELKKINEEKSEKIASIEEKCLTLEEQLQNNKNLILQKEKELISVKEKLQKLPAEKEPSESTNSSLKKLEEENLSLKHKITLLELEKVEKKPDTSSLKASSKELSPEEAEEKESLLSQIDFLNSIIVDMKQKNEELTRQLEAQTTCWEDSNDINLNETKKTLAPRLFCDICDMFDLHETCDCPKQESFVDDEIPQLRKPGTRQLEERPYCNNCEVFGHWTLDCEEPETF